MYHISLYDKQIFINESADLYDIKEVLWEVEFYSNSATSYTEYERFGSTIGINNTNTINSLNFLQSIFPIREGVALCGEIIFGVVMIVVW